MLKWLPTSCCVIYGDFYEALCFLCEFELPVFPAVLTENKIPTANEINDLQDQHLYFACIYR